MELGSILSILIVLIAASITTAQMRRNVPLAFQRKRICLLIAHPDDEAMFFSPTLSTLTNPALQNHVKIICLSSGDADGLGEIRKTELGKSAQMLGLRSANDVLVLEDEAFPDSMTVTWSKEKIAGMLAAAFSPSSAGKGRKYGPPETTMDILITFDENGVSSHPNHISLYYGAKTWLTGLMTGKGGWNCPVELYTLSSINIVRKYISFLDGPVTLVYGALRTLTSSKKRRSEQPPNMVFMSSFKEYRSGQNAMTKGHRSQMRWFRWGWITIGRYMIVNDLKRETL